MMAVEAAPRSPVEEEFDLIGVVLADPSVWPQVAGGERWDRRAPASVARWGAVKAGGPAPADAWWRAARFADDALLEPHGGKPFLYELRAKCPPSSAVKEI